MLKASVLDIDLKTINDQLVFAVWIVRKLSLYFQVAFLKTKPSLERSHGFSFSNSGQLLANANYQVIEKVSHHSVWNFAKFLKCYGAFFHVYRLTCGLYVYTTVVVAMRHEYGWWSSSRKFYCSSALLVKKARQCSDGKRKHVWSNGNIDGSIHCVLPT